MIPPFDKERDEYLCDKVSSSNKDSKVPAVFDKSNSFNPLDH
jgi:hypothetical protein